MFLLSFDLSVILQMHFAVDFLSMNLMNINFAKALLRKFFFRIKFIEAKNDRFLKVFIYEFSFD